MRISLRASVLLAAGFALLASPAYAAPARPDLSVTKLQVAGSVAPGQAVSATVTVKNAGRGKAKGTQAALTLSKDAKAGKDDRALTTGSIKSLAKRKSAGATFKLTVPAGTATGTYRVIACADPKNKVRESNEKNNCRASGPFQVRSGVFGSPQPSGPLTPAPGGDPGPGPDPRRSRPPRRRPPRPPRRPRPPPRPRRPPPPPPRRRPPRRRSRRRRRPTSPSPRSRRPRTPATSLPTPQPTEPTTVAEGTEFLYTGANPIQKEVAAGTIEAQQVAVIRGKVLKADGTPMKGARVTVLDHSELGYTSTREDGGYDLAVNGGADLTLTFEQDGFMSVQRTEPIPWQDYVDLADVVMTPYDTKVTDDRREREHAAGRDAQDHARRRRRRRARPRCSSSPARTRRWSSRTARPSRSATSRSAPPSTRSAPTARSACPASCRTRARTRTPSSSRVDEAVEAGATDVKFTKPVTTYVDNFLGFKAGTIVPSAYYDEGKGAWVPSKNGLVIKIVSETSGRANVDTDGDGTADNTGIDDAERQKLAQQYDAGKSLWRVEVEHFTPWDYNWPYGCRAQCDAPDEEPPPPPYCPECEAAGSIIGVFNQTLGEKLSRPGHAVRPLLQLGPRARLQGGLPARDPADGQHDQAVAAARRARGRPSPGASSGRPSSPRPNLKHAFEWDGKDAYGREVQGAQNAEVRIGYVYPAEYLEPAEFEASFGQFGGAPVTRNESGATEESRREIIAWQEWERPVGTLGAGADALGGWTLDVHHAYDPQSRTLYLGDGSKVTTEAIRSEIGTAVGVSDDGVWDPSRPATNFPLDIARGTDAGADGSIYVAETERRPRARR